MDSSSQGAKPVSSNQVSVDAASLDQVDKEEDTDITKLNFDDFFFNPLLQNNAWNVLSNCNFKKISDGDSQEEKRQLRKRKLGDDLVIEPQVASNSSTVQPLPTNSENKTTPFMVQNKIGGSEPTAPQVEDLTLGNKIIDDIIERYENAKKKYKMSTCDNSNVDPDETSELEELSSDGELDVDGDSKFVTNSIPQYDEKKLLCDKHYEAIRKVTPKRVEEILIRILPQLRKIKDNILPCKRNQYFWECGISKQILRDHGVTKPFTSAQEYRVISVIKNTFFDSEDELQNGREIIHYIRLVLLPEALIRIYARVNKVDYELAEKEMLFGGKYDGALPESVLKPTA